MQARERILFICHTANGHIIPAVRALRELTDTYDVDVLCNAGFLPAFADLAHVHAQAYPLRPFLLAGQQVRNAKRHIRYGELLRYFSVLSAELFDWLVEAARRQPYAGCVLDARASFALPLRSAMPQLPCCLFYPTLRLRQADFARQHARGCLPEAYRHDQIDAEAQALYQATRLQHPALAPHLFAAEGLLRDLSGAGHLLTHPLDFDTDPGPDTYSLYRPHPDRQTRGAGELIYVSFGTEFNDLSLRDAVPPLLRRLAASGLPVVYACGGDTALYAALQPCQSACISVLLRADQPAMLARAALFVSHGGMNSVIEALALDCPVLCCPQGDDQWLIADRLETLGLGIGFDRIETLSTDARLTDRALWAALRARIREMNDRLDARAPRPLAHWLAARFRAPAGEPAATDDLAARFAQQAQRTPDWPALSCAGETLTYQALLERVERLAHHLRAAYRRLHGVDMPAGTLLGLCLGRGLDLYTAMLAVLRAGAAFVPIAPELPPGRVRVLLEDTACPLILTDTDREGVVHASLEACTSRPAVLNLDAWRASSTGDDAGLLPGAPDGAARAYVLYTSGTTGRPKGVQISHANVSRLVESHWARFDSRACRTGLLFASCAFDASVFEFFPGLLSGQHLVVCTEADRQDPQRLEALIATHQVDIATLPPVLLECLRPEALTSLRRLIVAGETPSSALMARLAAVTQVFNAYGPTEATVCATAHAYRPGDAAANIGTALPHVRCRVLTDDGQEAGVGESGELYLGGTGLSCGYLNRPESDRAAFVHLPPAHGDGPSSRYYRTGDRVRRLHGDAFEFLGRIDAQLKIAGHRIEPGEIEAVLTQHPDARQAVVVLQAALGAQHLAAYVVPRRHAPQLAEQILAHARALLPPAMWPRSLTLLDALPVTLNGKVDHRALPLPLRAGGDDAGAAPLASEVDALCRLMARVLCCEAVGPQSDFYRLGGDSVRAMQLSVLVRSTLARALPVAAILSARTPAGMAACLEDRAPADRTAARAAPEAGACVAPAQEGMLFQQQLMPASLQFHLQALFACRETLDPARLGAALADVLARHDMLASGVVLSPDGQWRMRPGAAAPPLTLTRIGAQTELCGVLRAFNDRAFDLASAPLMRVMLVQSAQRDWLFCVWHHAIFDGGSLPLFLDALTACYRAQPQPAQPVPGLRYADWAARQRRRLAGAAGARLQAFWTAQMAGYQPWTLTTDAPRPARFDSAGQECQRVLSPALSAALRALARQQGVSLFAVLLTGFYLALYRVTGRDDLIVGAPFDTRDDETHGLIGLFVNLLPLRQRLHPQQTGVAVLQAVHAMVLQCKAHQDWPLARLIAALQLPRDPARHPLFQIIFGLSPRLAQTPDALFTPVVPTPPVPWATETQCDLSLMIDTGGEQMTATLRYASRLFAADAMSALLATCQDSLDALCRMPEARLDHWRPRDPVPVPASAAQPSPSGLHQLFEAQARRQPDQPALVFEGQQLSYAALDQAASRLAGQLRAIHQARHAHPLPAGAPIGLCLERGIAMVVAMLAVLKAGAAYVPLDPKLPDDRLARMLADTHSPLLLCHDAPRAARLVRMSGLTPGPAHGTLDAAGTLLDPPGASAALPETHPDDLAYILYTSGSTGTPKGVMIRHRTAVNMVRAHIERLDTARMRRALLFAPFSFDGSVFELFVGLASGHQLFLCSEAQRQDPRLTEALIEQYRIEMAAMTPSLLSVIDPECLRALKILLVAGEAAPADLMQRLSQVTQVINAYGPTEATVAVCCHAYRPGDAATNIGRPFAHIRLYVLDADMQPVPDGEAGELYIGGDCLAAGYLNQPALTAQAFVDARWPDPRAPETTERLYKTGDRVRRLRHGDLEYLGRVDRQVKIRGQRLELQELEQCLAAQPGVAQAVAMVERHRGIDRLEAYLAPHPGMRLDLDRIRRALQAVLPAYAVPSVLTAVPVMPRTHHGKIDLPALRRHAAVPVPASPSAPASAPIRPADTIDAVVRQVWQTVLGQEAIDPERNFFDIGGNSLLLVQVREQLSRRLQRSIDMITLFEYPSINQLCRHLHQQAAVPDTRRPQGGEENSA